jgi:hypothetical protein
MRKRNTGIGMARSQSHETFSPSAPVIMQNDKGNFRDGRAENLELRAKCRCVPVGMATGTLLKTEISRDRDSS